MTVERPKEVLRQRLDGTGDTRDGVPVIQQAIGKERRAS
jgi:hypothetical protein